MKLVCISDLHGRLEALEGIKGGAAEADILIAAGDITNFGKRRTSQEVVGALLDLNPNLLAVPGNCDTPEVNDVLSEEGISLHGSGRAVEGIGFFGAGGSNVTPFGTPQEYTDEALVQLLEKGYGEVEAMETKVMVCHAPPHGTAIDVTRAGLHVGSRKVREFLEGHSLTLVISGHVHEAKGQDTLGRATIINPGPVHMGCAKAEVGNEVKVEFIHF